MCCRYTSYACHIHHFGRTPIETNMMNKKTAIFLQYIHPMHVIVTTAGTKIIINLSKNCFINNRSLIKLKSVSPIQINVRQESNIIFCKYMQSYSILWVQTVLTNIAYSACCFIFNF